MRDKHYKTLINVVNDYLDDATVYFSFYNAKFKQTAKETKSRAYGGYEVVRLTKDFEKDVSCKCTELLEKIEILFNNSGRKLAAEQYNDLINKCTKKFNAIIDNYWSVFQEEFESIETCENSFKILKENITCKINNYIRAFKCLSNTKIDKALLWTAIGTVFAGISLILSVIAIIVSI